MTRHELLDTAAQDTEIDVPVEVEHRLHGVDIDTVGVESGQKEHAALQWCQRYHVLDTAGHRLIEGEKFVDTDSGRGHFVGDRSDPAGEAPGDRDENIDPAVGDEPNRGFVEQSCRKTEFGAQHRSVRPVVGDRVDGQDMVEWDRTVHRTAERSGFRRTGPGSGRRFPQRQPSQVVEQDLGCAIAGEPVRRVRHEVPHQTESDSVVGHGAQRFLDVRHRTGQGRACRRVASVTTEVEQHRVERGEPADRPGQVHPRHDLFFASVSLEVDS